MWRLAWRSSGLENGSAVRVGVRQRHRGAKQAGLNQGHRQMLLALSPFFKDLYGQGPEERKKRLISRRFRPFELDQKSSV
jgi:hypothetical protein